MATLLSDLREMFPPNQSPDAPVGPGANDGRMLSDNAAAPGYESDFRAAREIIADGFTGFLKYLTGYDIGDKNFSQVASDVLGAPVSAVNDMLNRLTGNDELADTTGAKGQSSSPIPPTVSHYINADVARQYGMDNATAYQEALANTSYQRAVKDMQAAGLNPAALYGSGKGYTAGGVSYVSDGSGYGSGNSRQEHLFSSGLYNGIPTAAGILASVVAPRSHKMSAYYLVSNAAKGIMQLADGFVDKD